MEFCSQLRRRIYFCYQRLVLSIQVHAKLAKSSAKNATLMYQLHNIP